MKNPVLEDIRKYAIRRLQEAYGFVGTADAPTFCLLNSGQDVDITIEIKEVAPEEEGPTS